MSGRRRGLPSAFLRATLACAEPIYRGIVALRNTLYDRGILKIHRLPAPVISIGNITTGGTGKTPVVRWLAEELARIGRRPGILLRGYKSDAAGSDEQLMLVAQLPDFPVMASPDRVAAARSISNQADIFLLDDGFQHRRVARDFDLVLINATQPFGFGHVLPRGLLRESLDGLGRASAIVLTHISEVSPGELEGILGTISKYASAPIYFSDHLPLYLLDPNDNVIDLKELSRTPFFAFAGIGDPQSFDRQLQQFGDSYRGHHWFGDHAHYDRYTVEKVAREAREKGAMALVTTEKDWAKLGEIGCGVPIWRVVVGIQFHENQGPKLLEQIEQLLAGGSRG
jgi:tetraacyldisaccharide 4'-kinase